MINFNEPWEFRKQQLEMLEKCYKAISKFIEIESDRMTAIGLLNNYDRMRAIQFLLKVGQQYYNPDPVFLQNLLSGNISDFFIQYNLGYVAQTIIPVAVSKYVAEERMKEIAKEVLESNFRNNWWGV